MNLCQIPGQWKERGPDLSSEGTSGHWEGTININWVVKHTNIPSNWCFSTPIGSNNPVLRACTVTKLYATKKREIYFGNHELFLICLVYWLIPKKHISKWLFFVHILIVPTRWWIENLMSHVWLPTFWKLTTVFWRRWLTWVHFI